MAAYWKTIGHKCYHGLVGLVALPTGREIWPGILIAYLITVILEWILMLCLSQWLNIKSSARSLFKISAKMNFASYTFLAITLICLVYIPPLNYEDHALLEKMSGRIFVVLISSRELNMNNKPFTFSKSIPMDIPLLYWKQLFSQLH